VTPPARVIASVAIPISADDAPGLQRADIVVDGLEQAGASFELRVFLNNAAADASSALAEDAGYAGSIYIYGYGQPPDEVGSRSARPRLPMTRYVMATEAIRTAAAAGPTAVVTLVPVAADAPGADIDISDAQVTIRIGN